jgi:histidyl-tRNA synthetase
MSEKLQPIKGTKDLLPQDYLIYDYIVRTALDRSSLYGFETCATPIIEYVSVFDRTLGETSDVVRKEMYDFFDKSNRHIALRPEFTAGIMRAFISNNLSASIPLRLASHGPVFRYDNPQAGRQRQFHQINFEHIGATGSITDAEIIKLAVDILADLNILNSTTLEISSLGCKESRSHYQNALKEFFSSYQDDLSKESQSRLEKNPLRILDSKDINDQKIVALAPLITDFYTNETKEYFAEVLEYLDSFGILYKVNPKLVRGLDYYSHTAFEFTTTLLGAQGTVLAGGRYDALSKMMGGPDVPSIGFAAGVERLALLSAPKTSKKRPCVILPFENAQIKYATEIATILRNENIPALIESAGKLSKRIQKAVNMQAEYIIFLGSNEEEVRSVKIKNLDTHEEQTISVTQIEAFFSLSAKS